MKKFKTILSKLILAIVLFVIAFSVYNTEFIKPKENPEATGYDINPDPIVDSGSVNMLILSIVVITGILSLSSLFSIFGNNETINEETEKSLGYGILSAFVFSLLGLGLYIASLSIHLYNNETIDNLIKLGLVKWTICLLLTYYVVYKHLTKITVE